MPPPKVPNWFMEEITSISRFVAKIRAKVSRDYHTREIAYRTRSEIGIRLCSQLLKLSLSLAVVLDKKTLDKEILDITRAIASHTSRGFNFEIVQSIAECIEHGGVGLDKSQLSKKLDLVETAISKRLEDLRIVGLVSRVEIPNTSGARGRHRHVWKINDEYLSLWKSLNEESRS